MRPVAHIFAMIGALSACAAGPAAAPEPMDSCDDLADCRSRCDEGDAAACERLAALSPERIEGFSRDRAPSDREGERQPVGGRDACGDPEACLAQAEELAASDPARAVAILEPLCGAENDARACYELGRLVEEGRGVTPNALRARALYGASCDLRHPPACRRLAELEEDGGAQPFWGELAEVLESKCDDDDAFACGELAELFAEGKGREKNAERALELYQKACQLSEEACARYPRP